MALCAQLCCNIAQDSQPEMARDTREPPAMGESRRQTRSGGARLPNEIAQCLGQRMPSILSFWARVFEHRASQLRRRCSGECLKQLLADASAESAWEAKFTSQEPWTVDRCAHGCNRMCMCVRTRVCCPLCSRTHAPPTKVIMHPPERNCAQLRDLTVAMLAGVSR